MRPYLFRISILVLLCFHQTGTFLAAETPVFFQWKWKENQVLELNEYHEVLFRVGTKVVEREDKNRVVLKTLACDSVKCSIDSWFDTYIRYGKTQGPFWKDKEYSSQFDLYRNGRYLVPEKYTMPNLRSFPSFPENPVLVGDRWKLPAEESFDFSKERFLVKVEPDYTYLGKAKWSFAGVSGSADHIQYTYPIFYQKQNPDMTSPSVPYKVFGFAQGSIFFDSMKGIPEYKEVKLSYTFVFPNGTVQEANFYIRGIYTLRNKLVPTEKEAIKEDILQNLIVGYTKTKPIPSMGQPGKTDLGYLPNPNESNKNEGEPTASGIPINPEEEKNELPISVRTTEDGVVFSLDSILFDFNDSKLKTEAEEAVSKIAQVLKKYSDREIRVSGHTDNVGKKEYNQKLSEDRAKSVLQNLIDKHQFDEKKLSFRGYGDSKPVVSNDTEGNRKKNRRVEITLVLD